MAVTKIHAIKSTVKKAINYILDPDKTDGTLLATGFGCEPVTAYLDFQMTADLAQRINGNRTNIGGADNLAYHLIQSFSKTDKLSPENAHEIGKELADSLFKGKHEYVITTHIDKNHIHNHVIVNAVSFVDFSKFRTRPYETVRQIREISDKLCRARGLHVIDMPQGKGRESKKWHTQPSWRDRLQLAVDKAIYTATSYQEFIDLLRKENIEVKEGKHIAFRLPGQQRYARGKSIGPRYEREQIMERIASPNKEKNIPFLPKTRIEKSIYHRSSRQIIEEIQAVTSALVTTRKENVNTVKDYNIRLKDLRNQCEDVRKTIKILDERIAQFREVTKALITYDKNLPLMKQYEKLPLTKRKRFFAANESQLRLFSHAQDILKQNNIAPEDPAAAIEILKEQVSRSNELMEQYKAIEQRIENLSKARGVILKVIGERELEALENERKKEKQKNIR